MLPNWTMSSSRIRKRTISTSSNMSTASNNSNNESVKVTVRCRPPNKTEHNNCWNLWEKNKILSNNPRLKKQHSYSFDNVLYGSDNHALYSSGIESLISQAMEGYNATVFAYGQTASGKTFTMVIQYYILKASFITKTLI
ncbi:unnamed protein product [Mucor hiemalis]